jgi:hypothetical protein
MEYAILTLREFPVRAPVRRKTDAAAPRRLSPDTRANSMFSHHMYYLDTSPFVFARLQPIES